MKVWSTSYCHIFYGNISILLVCKEPVLLSILVYQIQLCPDLYRQVAVLSQRGCTMLRVIEYFAKSLKVIQNDTVE